MSDNSNPSKQLSAVELQKIAAQLACPHGEGALPCGQSMAVNNRSMIEDAINHLQLNREKETCEVVRVLELGFGSAVHLNWLLQQANNIKYIGIEKSTAMYQAAIANNRKFIDLGQVCFHCFNGINLTPQLIEFIDKVTHIFTVNTIYFWEQPAVLLADLADRLQVGGIFNICFCEREFMETLPFTQYGFSMYDEQEVLTMAKRVGLHHLATYQGRDITTSKAGDLIKRRYITISLSKM